MIIESLDRIAFPGAGLPHQSEARHALRSPVLRVDRRVAGGPRRAGGALADVSLRTLPLRDGDAEAMIAETRAGALLAGHRGRPPGDVAALVHCLTTLTDFAWSERDHLLEIDVNPIIVGERGCVVVDALIVRRCPARPSSR
jgi:hypothetical protein